MMLLKLAAIGLMSSGIEATSVSHAGGTGLRTQEESPRAGIVGEVPLSRLPVVMVNKACPKREETISMALWEDGRVTVNVTDGDGSSEPVELCQDAGQLLGRGFDVEYSRKSGVALAVCFDASRQALRCMTYDGKQFARRASLPVPGGLRVGYLGLRARGETDEFVLMVSGVARDGRIRLLTNTWDGKEWQAWETVSEDLAKDQVDVKKERGTGGAKK